MYFTIILHFFTYIYVVKNKNIMSECKKCNQKSTSKRQYLTIVLGFYLLIAAIYGTITLVNDVILLLK